MTATIFTAKYNGKCAWSGREIVEGETKIVSIRKEVVLAEYGQDDGVGIVNELIEKLASMMEANGQHERATKMRESETKSLEISRKFGNPFDQARKLQQKISWFLED